MHATVSPYDPNLFDSGSVSHAGTCGQGGQDTCHDDPVFAVVSDKPYRVACCDRHLHGAVRQALGLPKHRG